METKSIGLVALGAIPPLVIKIISAHVSGYLDLPTVHLPAQRLPQSCIDPNRQQCDAAKLIQHLQALEFSACVKVIGIVDVDLFVPIFTHVFGEAQQGGSHAAISLHRLKSRDNGARVSEAQFYERTAKVALHETGHLFNLFHCRNPRCLMHFSGDTASLDATALSFCPYCTQFFDDACRRAGIPKEKLF